MNVTRDSPPVTSDMWCH